MNDFVGTWKLSSTDKFDEYMKAIGVGFILRKVANQATPVQTITADGDSMKIVTSTAFKTTIIEFSLDKEFDEVRGDDKKLKSVVTLQENKLIHTQKTLDGEKVGTIDRYLEDDNKTLVMILKAKDSSGNEVVCTRKYSRVE